MLFRSNEFGHPEWIDFPREGNGWSFHYCRRQWSLQDNPYLKYRFLGEFDRDMVAVTKEVDMFSQLYGNQHMMDDTKKCIVFSRKGLLFAFNFHPSWSQGALRIPVQKGTCFDVVFTSDDWKYGGWGQINHGSYPAHADENGFSTVSLYLPARTAMVLREGEVKQIVKEVPETKVEKAPEEVKTKKTTAAKTAAEKKTVSDKKDSKKGTSKKTASEKTAAKKTASKKAASEKTASEKTAAKKTVSKKAATEKAASKKTAPARKKVEKEK